MLMNGKEVNHLVINGDRFDKSYVGLKIKINKGSLPLYGELTFDGDIANYLSTADSRVTDFTILAKYKDKVYISRSFEDPNNAYGAAFGWTDISNVTVLKNGGVNKPSYLLFIYCMKEVAPSC